MINANTSSKAKPFILKPAGKDYLWGGNRLNAEFNKDIPLSPLAETWECSTHPDGASVVANGEYQGMTLIEVLKKHPEYMGAHLKNGEKFPILIKFIDAKQNLSVQVHPNDNYAREYEQGQLGKTEMWYVIDASKKSELIYGFRHDMTKEQLEKSLAEGSVEKYLQKIRIKKDDVFFIKAGTVHAIGAGALIIEVQENSNLTYRMYDYNRLDKHGKQRELHLKKAMDVINLKGSLEPRQPLRLLKYKKGEASEFLCRCKHFQVERHLLNTESSKKLVEFQTKENTFKIFVCINGCGVIFMEDGDNLNFFKGDCIFVPAESVRLKFHGSARFLSVSC